MAKPEIILQGDRVVSQEREPIGDSREALAALTNRELASRIAEKGKAQTVYEEKPQGSGSYNGGEWGTTLLPKITHVTGDVDVSGNVTGCGVLIVDGSLRTRGNFAFAGLIIIRGKADIHGAGGSEESATVWGAVLIGVELPVADLDHELTIGGRGAVHYSSQALAAVVNKWPGPFSGLTMPAKLVAWHELL